MLRSDRLRGQRLRTTHAQTL